MREHGDKRAERLDRLWLAAFFTVSGFCSLVYEIVWLRLAMARFGVNTALVSIVLSVFMAGLGLGSWLAGRAARRLRARSADVDLRLYAACELLIGLGGLVAPAVLARGGAALARTDAAWGSAACFAASGAWIALALLPWCAAMGATIPLAMSAVGKAAPGEARRSFSFLYLANVLGAALGSVVAAFVLVELFGFRGTGWFAASLNAALALAAYGLSRRWARLGRGRRPAAPARARDAEHPPAARSALGLLFLTGFVSMGLEVVWTRQLIPYLGLHVYAFASLLALYLLSYELGSFVYRRSAAPRPDSALAWAVAGLCGSAALAAADPRLPLELDLGGGILRLYFIVAPFSVATGFLTPLLVDAYSSGEPEAAGKAYAANVAGCILGPLAASFALLPFLSERWSEAALLLVLLAGAAGARGRGGAGRGPLAAAAALALVLALFARDFASAIKPPTETLRDSGATVVAYGSAREEKRLFVNGIAMTRMQFVTKNMAHLPLAFSSSPPKSVLILCFGMGTTFRSALSWGVPTTVVELSPSVPKLFGYFHADGPELLKSPLARVVIDDGRRFLARTRERYDVITLDPAPPMQAAGNSLLYSREFYAAAKERLGAGGVLQQWYWEDAQDPYLLSSYLAAVKSSFRFVRTFNMGKGGLQILASDEPIPRLTARELAGRLPPAARADFLEWSPSGLDAEGQFAGILSLEIPVDVLLASLPPAPALSDDRPRNEYYLLRRAAAAFDSR